MTKKKIFLGTFYRKRGGFIRGLPFSPPLLAPLVAESFSLFNSYREIEGYLYGKLGRGYYRGDSLVTTTHNFLVFSLSEPCLALIM
jgi:hypothetical protein